MGCDGLHGTRGRSVRNFSNLPLMPQFQFMLIGRNDPGPIRAERHVRHAGFMAVTGGVVIARFGIPQAQGTIVVPSGDPTAIRTKSYGLETSHL